MSGPHRQTPSNIEISLNGPPGGLPTAVPALPQIGPAAQPLLLCSPSTRRGSRAVRALAALLIAAGLLTLADAGTTLLWQEPISALYAQLKQESLGGDLRALDRAQPAAAAERTLARLHEENRRIAYLAGALEDHARAGSAVGRIGIPAIGASFVVVKGTGTSELQNGPGIYSQTRFPGIGGTTAIAGHRTTYLAPFRHIDALRPGQRIVLEMPYARFTYTVVGSRVVLPTDVSVIGPAGYPRLVLSACTPLFSASHRIVVFARLTSTAPLGAARSSQPMTRAGTAAAAATGDERGGSPTVLKASQRLLPPLVS